MLKCYTWCLHVLCNRSIWWSWEKNFPSKWTNRITFQVLCRFSILLCVFKFFPPNFNVSYSLTNVWLFTRAYTSANHTGWMGISTFQFKQLNLNFQFNFLMVIHLTRISYLLWVKTSNLFNTTFFGTSKKPGRGRRGVM